jgi:hypothetical protein
MTAIALDRATNSPPAPTADAHGCTSHRFAPAEPSLTARGGHARPIRKLNCRVWLLVLSERYGPIRQLMLNRDAWTRGHAGSPSMRVSSASAGSPSVDPALAIATTEHGDQLDLLVVPPATAEAQARDAMERAADPTHTTRAPGILAGDSWGVEPDRT